MVKYSLTVEGQYKEAVAKAASIRAGTPKWVALPRYVRVGNQTLHPGVVEMYAEVSSAAAEIYAASVALGRLLHMSYVCDEMGREFEMPLRIGVDKATAVTFAAGTVNRISCATSMHGKIGYKLHAIRSSWR